MVVAGCHSLTSVDDILHGDPLEASALEGIRWQWNATSHIARPRPFSTGIDTRPSPDTTQTKQPQKKQLNESVSNSVDDSGREPVAGGDGDDQQEAAMSVRVLRRHAFSSQLQRMSVVAKVLAGGGGLTANKGIPEVCASERVMRMLAWV